MRTLLSIGALLALAASGSADGWMLKSPLKEKQHTVWRLTVTANVSGSEHQAQITQTLDIASKTDKGFKGTTAWSDVQMDGSDLQQELPKWDVTFAPNGAITSAGESADYARMLAPGSFVYPDKEVAVGDKWTSKFKPATDAKEITVDYEVVAQEKAGDIDALKIKAKLSEDGPMKGTETFWIGKDGSLLKFDMELKSWTVPFAGDPSEFDAKIHGDWVKPKN